MTPEQRAIAIVDAAEKCKCDYLAETFCNKCGHSHGRTGCDWRRMSGLWVSPTVAVAAIAAALTPSVAVKRLLSHANMIFPQRHEGHEARYFVECQRPYCIGLRETLDTVREELGL